MAVLIGASRSPAFMPSKSWLVVYVVDSAILQWQVESATSRQKSEIRKSEIGNPEIGNLEDRAGKRSAECRVVKGHSELRSGRSRRKKSQKKTFFWYGGRAPVTTFFGIFSIFFWKLFL